MDEMLMIYIEDLKDNNLMLNEALLSSGAQSEYKERINSIFRVAHTIKGNSATMEFHNIEKVMHRMEDILYDVREGKRSLTEEIERTLFSCHDFLEDCTEILLRDGHDRNVQALDLLRLIECLGDDEETETKKVSLEVLKSASRESFLESLDSELIELIKMNTKRGLIPYVLQIKIDERSEMSWMRAYLAFQKVEDYATLLHSVPERCSEEDLLSSDLPACNDLWLLVLLPGDIGELATEVESGIDIESVHYWQLEESWLNKTLVDDVPLPVEKAVAPKSGRVPTVGEVIKVPADKIDKLIDMLGELSILHTQVEQNLAGKELGSDCENALQRTGKIVREIQHMSLSLRMVEIKSILHRLTRIVRDTSVELGKEIHVSLEGESTEIDKSVADKIFDPLMHMVRNAVSHGIEDRDLRREQDKPEIGSIRIQAYNKRDHVYIEVIDDGRGLDADLILAKALNLNIAKPDQQYSESEIFKFIFAPGFSTQKEVNKISGRGVGMNVVEDVVKKMRGKIDIRSQKGHGSTFSIKIPMNLSVLNGIIVKIHEERYIVPTVVINEIITPENEQWIRVNNKIVGVHIRDNIFPIIDPYHMLGYGEGPSIDSFDYLVVLEHDGRFIGLPVDGITGRQEIVSKKLGSQFKQLSYAAGASILGDGKVSVILDVDALFSMKMGNPSSLSGKTELI